VHGQLSQSGASLSFFLVFNHSQIFFQKMKKLSFLFAAGLLFAGSHAFGQDYLTDVTSEGSGSSGDFKATSGVTLDVNFSPFSESGVWIDRIRTRYFMSPDLALRIGLGIERNSTTYDNLESGADLIQTKSSTTLLNPTFGVEKHFPGTDRLSPYIGGDLGLGLFSARAKRVVGEDYEYIITGATDNGLGNQRYTALTFAAVAGANFYFAKHAYLGIEVGLGGQFKSLGKVEEDDNGTVEVLFEDKVNSFRFEDYANAGLLLGFKF